MLRMSSNLARCLVLQGPYDPERLLAALRTAGAGMAGTAPDQR